MSATTSIAHIPASGARSKFSPGLRLAIALGCCLLAMASFMVINAPLDFEFILEFRGSKIAAMALVGWATGVATVAFQTVTANRLLTPAILGLDALYTFLHTLLIFVFGISFVNSLGPYWIFAALVSLMLLASSALTYLLFGRKTRTVYLVVLVGLVIGAILRAFSSLINRIMDPTSYLVLQGNLFATFTAVNPELVGVCALIVAAISGWFWRQRYTLDVVSLGRDAAVSLGVNYTRFVRHVLLGATMLVCVSTALVGPITFLGLIVSAIAYQLAGTGRHAATLPMAGLLGIIMLVGGQAILEQVFGLGTVLSVIIEFVGGIAFIWIVIRKASK